MNWETHVRSAEAVLLSSRIPASEEIISLIKRVNPTSLQLSESDRERGYRLKNELQNLLLENYGESFRLDQHPYYPDILLIKHKTLPSIDACHTRIQSLSLKALDAICVPAPAKGPAVMSAAKKPGVAVASSASPREALRMAQGLLAEYEYAQAEELLAGIRIGDSKDLPTLTKAARILIEEMGAYDKAAATLLSQPRGVLKDKMVRELLGVAYHRNDMIPEARALFDTLHPADLGASALLAHADISFRDGNLSSALKLLKLSEAKEGFLPEAAGLREKVEECIRAQAEPWLRQAEEALARRELDQACSLAQQVLIHCPHSQEARRLLCTIETIKAGSEVETLWRRLEDATPGDQRIAVLARLLELDKGNDKKIVELMSAEKAELKKRSIEERLCHLGALAAQQNWPECFDILLWLPRQGGAPDRLRFAFGISPYFSVLYQNRRLQRVPDEKAKEHWLSFVQAVSQFQGGNPEGCLERLKQTKRYFQSYPVYKEAYECLLELEQSAARREAEELLGELQSGYCSLTKANGLATRIRKAIALLPLDEAAWFRDAVQEELSQFIRENRDEENLEDYRMALLVGNAARAASLRDAIADKRQVALIDVEIAEYFRILVHPVTVTLAPDLSVDLATASTSLTLIGSTQRHAILREDDENIIIFYADRLSAARFSSPNFKDLGYLDSLPAKDVFLFANCTTNNHVWRAVLSETEAHFSAEIVINENFIYLPGASFAGMLMSSSKDNDYYAFIQEGEQARAVRQTLDVCSNTIRTYDIKGEVKHVRRLSYQPDSFIIGTETGTIVLNGNLTIPHGFSRPAAEFPFPLFAVDVEKGEVYVGSNFIKVLNTKLKITRQYPNAVGGAFISTEAAQGLCRSTDTGLISFATGKGTFYNLQSNAFSQLFSLSRLLWTDTPSSWHYFEYDKDRSTLAIRDITHELDTLLEWQVLCTPDQDEETQFEMIRQLEDPNFFNLGSGETADIVIREA